jgi:hypothetical protein
MNPLGLWTPAVGEVEPLPDGSILHISRSRNGVRKLVESMKIGPNEVHAFISHMDGSITDLGISHNLLTNGGRDLAAAAIGNATQASGALTASSATSATPSGGGLTTDQYKGWRVWCPVTGVTTAPVYGNIGSNSTTVLTVDQWWTAAEGVGTTPASTNGYFITPTGLARFMGLTTDSGAASASDTVLASEITNNGASRALATYAHTGGTATFTLQKAYSITGTITAIHKMGLFTAANTTAAGILYFESVLNADATVVNGDTLTVTDTVTLS